MAQNEPQSGHPKDVTVPISKLMKYMKPCMAMNDRIVTIQHIAISVGISFGLIQIILSDVLHTTKLSVSWVPKMLTLDKKLTD